MTQIAALNTKPRKTQAYPPPREFDATQFLNDCASQIVGEPVVLIWHGNPETGIYDGFDVLEAGEGFVGAVWVK